MGGTLGIERRSESFPFRNHDLVHALRRSFTVFYTIAFFIEVPDARNGRPRLLRCGDAAVRLYGGRSAASSPDRRVARPHPSSSRLSSTFVERRRRGRLDQSQHIAAACVGPARRAARVILARGVALSRVAALAA